MAKTLYKYEASSNKFVWFTTWDRALRNYYTDDYNYVPDPVVDSPFNTYVEFRSRKPGMANVDWGDGIKEQFPMTKVQGEDNYRIIFRSLAIQHRKIPILRGGSGRRMDRNTYLWIIMLTLMGGGTYNGLYR